MAGKIPRSDIKQMKSAVMQHLINSGDMEAAEKAAYRMTPKAFRSVKREQKVNLNYQEV